MLDSGGQAEQLAVRHLALTASVRIAEPSTNLEAVINAPRRKRRSFLCYQQDFRCDVPFSKRFRGESIALARRCRASYGRGIYLGVSGPPLSLIQNTGCSTDLSKYNSSPLLIVVSKASVGGSSCSRKPRSRSSSLHFSRSPFTVGVVLSVAVAHALESTIYAVSYQPSIGLRGELHVYQILLRNIYAVFDKKVFNALRDV